jgi:hypothetical protein
LFSSQENNQKRKFDENLFPNKKHHSSSNEEKQTEIISKSTTCMYYSLCLLTKQNSFPLANSVISSNENSGCRKDLLDEELNRQKAKLITTEEQRHKKHSIPTKLRSNAHKPLQKQPITTIIKS